jgi:hypothetical protein
MATTRRQRAAAAKLDARITKPKKAPMESRAAEKADKPAISPMVMYFLMFVLFGSTIFGLIQTLQAQKL